MSAPRPASPRIVLCTLNAKYIHASLGLRYLLANMGELADTTRMCEFTISRPAQEMADELLTLLGEPGAVQVIGFGVYIWNVTQTLALMRLLRVQRPGLKIVLGGPEVSHELEAQAIVQLADHVITGWGDISFARLCRALLHGPTPLMKVIKGEQPPLAQIALPYAHYSAQDLSHRLLYVEASRGCPFKCEFCLSSLDKTAWAFDLDVFLQHMQDLYARGARNFKFVDRTFNLKIDASLRILQFFLDRLPTPGQLAHGVKPDVFVHFEVIPDQLPERLKQQIALFPPGVLQFEVGIQTFNVEVQQRISRRQDNAKTEANVRWLVNESNAHLHTDLIFGLPGETLASFAEGFDRLYALRPHEIQLGVLKRLRGTPLARHTEPFAMVYDPEPPYTVMQTAAASAQDMQRFVRLARYWDVVANSGRFQASLKLLLESAPPSAFAAWLRFSDWLWQHTAQTSKLTPERVVDALHAYFTQQLGMPDNLAKAALLADYVQSGARARPLVLAGLLSRRQRAAYQVSTTAGLATAADKNTSDSAGQSTGPRSPLASRQARHVAGSVKP